MNGASACGFLLGCRHKTSCVLCCRTTAPLSADNPLSDRFLCPNKESGQRQLVKFLGNCMGCRGRIAPANKPLTRICKFTTFINKFFPLPQGARGRYIPIILFMYFNLPWARLVRDCPRARRAIGNKTTCRQFCLQN